MPASRSPNRAAERPPARRWPLLLLLLPGLAAVCVAVIFILPASLITRVLPPDIHADDFSGTLLHGAAGTLTVKSRNAGAVEWQLHLIPLLRLSLVADIHWVKLAFVLDGTVETDAHGVTATHVVGGGPIESLNDLGLNSGWTGAAAVDFSTLATDFTKPLAAIGKITVTRLQSRYIAKGADLGSYLLQFPNDAVAQDGSISASLEDTGGPLAAQAQIRYSPDTHLGLFSGTLMERADASPALRAQLNDLAQLRPRDAQGRFPVELEFKL
jgi:hypothetical protein